MQVRRYQRYLVEDIKEVEKAALAYLDFVYYEGYGSDVGDSFFAALN